VKNVLKGLLREAFQAKQLFNLVVYLFAVFWIMQMLLSFAGLSENYILMIVLTIVVFSFIKKKLKKSD